MANAISKIEFYWDRQDPKNAGWYAIAKDADGYFVDDSMKIWFPVDVDQFGEDDGEKLASALTEAFPAASIVAA